MLDERGHIKLVDFGLAVPISANLEQEMSPKGSLLYMAPEMIRDKTGGRHTDWWAVGVLAHELLTGNSPWSSLTDKQVIKKEIINNPISPPGNITQEAGAFICSLMQQEPRQRLGYMSDVEVRDAPFFKHVDWMAAARLELPPPFVPNGDVVSDSRRQYALHEYRSRMTSTVPAAGWDLGLEAIKIYPEIMPP